MPSNRDTQSHDDPAARWERLTADQRAYLEERLRRSRDPAAPREAVPRRPPQSPPALSFAQERLWFLDQLEPGSTVYNRPWGVRLSGPLDSGALEGAINGIVRRHEVLRTTYTVEDGVPIQVIHPHRPHALPVVDLSGRGREAAEHEMARLAKEASRTPFDLSADRMLRHQLLRLWPAEHVLLLTTHHIAFDGWSEGIFLRELAAAYSSLLAEAQPVLPDLPLQYADFACWQREWLAGERLQRLEAFWRSALAGAPEVLTLRTDRARPARNRHQGVRLTSRIAPSLVERLRALSRRQEATLFMTLLAAFGVVLARSSGQLDLLVGCPTAGRTRIEVENLIGFFVDTLVVRCDLSGDPSFLSLLGRVRQAAIDAMAHQDLPFGKIVEITSPKRELNRLSLVQATFQLRNLPPVPERIGELSLDTYDFDPGLARFDLSLEAVERPDGLACRLVYDRDLFDETTARGILDCFEEILETVAERPEIRISSLQEARGAQSASPARLDRGGVDRTPGSNLTEGQLLIWLGEQRWPGTSLFNTSFAFSIEGDLEPEHFQKAFQALVDRSDALRAVIVDNEGLPRQLILPRVPDALQLLNFVGMADPQAAARAWMEENSRRPFDLRIRLFSSALVRVHPSKWIWFVNYHNAAGDLWSLRLIFQRVQEFYELSLRGELDGAASLPSYAEYVSTRLENGREPMGFARSQYWKEKLARASRPLAFYGARIAHGSTRVDRLSLDLGEERTLRLRAVANGSGFAGPTPNASILNVMLTTLCAYLHRLTGDRRLALGVPFYNRRDKGFRDTIGMIMEVLPLHVEIDDDETFRSLGRKVAQEATETLRHAPVPAGADFPRRTYEVSFNFHSLTFGSFLGRPVSVERLDTGHDDDTLALRLHDYKGSDSYTLDFLFNSEVFSAGQQPWAVGHFERLLDAILADPDARIETPDLLTPQERDRLLFHLNRSEAQPAPAQTVVAAFESQAAATPAGIAVVEGPRSLTYEALDIQANRWAHVLQSLGVGRRSLVAVCADRSRELIASILAILKAGAAYVPIDPTYPPERIGWMLDDSRPVLTLAGTDALRNSLGGSRRIVTLAELGASARRAPSAPPTEGPDPDQLAYVIYTSGSTGTPKAVMVEHRSLANYCGWALRTYRLGPTDGFLQFASIAWDTSAEEIFPALASGARLVLRLPSMLEGHASFLGACKRYGVTVADLPTSFWQELTAGIAAQGLELPGLRLVIIGGERALCRSVEQWREVAGRRVRLINTYGLTEATAVSTFADLTDPESMPRGLSEVPIGRPIDGVRAYVLDARHKPVPLGVAGELYLAGEGLARGYWRREDLTAERFMTGPFGPIDEPRLFATGDRVRFLPDGQLVCLGRIDDQVKVRGHRIEPGEIEALLSQHPGVKAAVVVAVADRDGKPVAGDVGDRLLAFFVPRPDVRPAPPPSELREFLRLRLPEFMLPAGYVAIEKLPLTPNGKVDRQALPLAHGVGKEALAAYVAPRDEWEEKLIEVWERTLGVHPISVTDDFFDLGGHSLLAVRLFAQIEKATGWRLPVRALFEAPTVEGLARLIRASSWSAAESPLVTLQLGGSKPPVFFIHAAGDHVVSFKSLARHLGSDQTAYALEGTQGDGDAEGPSILDRAERYLGEIQRVQPDGPYFLGGLSFGGLIALEVARLLLQRGESVALLALLDTRAPGQNWRSISHDLRYYLRQRIEYHLGNLGQLDGRARLEYLGHRLWGMARRTSKKVTQSMASAMARVRHPWPRSIRNAYGAALRAREAYSPTPYPGRITLFRAQRQPRGITDPYLGWGTLARGGVEVVGVPGTHVSIMSEPRLSALGDALRARVLAAQEEGK